MTLDDFLAETGLPDRTLRHYHQHGIIPQPGQAGHADHGYGELHVLRAHAIPLLREKGVYQLRDVRAHLDAMSLDELRRFVHGDDASEAQVAPTQAPVVASGAPAAHVGAVTSENHVHIRLRDGVVLDVRMPIDDAGMALVQSIASLCGVNVSFV